MDREAREALRIIQGCVKRGRFQLRIHFRQQLAKRGLFWPDVQALIDMPLRIAPGGLDRFDREKWLITGKATDGLPITLVCALEVTKDEDFTIFITAYTE